MLARLGLQLASYEDAEFPLGLDTDKKIATMQLPPCFLFQVRQLMLLQKISLLATELTFDATEDNNSQLLLSFDFSKPNEIFYRQLRDRFLK